MSEIVEEVRHALGGGTYTPDEAYEWLRTLLEENETLRIAKDHEIELHAQSCLDYQAQLQQLREELASEKKHTELGWEQSNKWLEENGRIRAELDHISASRDRWQSKFYKANDSRDKIADELDQVKKERDYALRGATCDACRSVIGENDRLREELAEKDKVLEEIADDVNSYGKKEKHSIMARSILSQYKGDTTYETKDD